MRGKSGDSLGRMLIHSGVLNEDSVQDVLDQQRHTLPFASLCYALGHADEESLVRVLAKQSGVPGVVLDQSVIELSILDGFEREICLTHGILPIYEDSQRIFIAAQEPARIEHVAREIRFVRGKVVVPHVALQLTLARAIRGGYLAREGGEAWLCGPHADPDAASPRVVVADISDTQVPGPEAAAREAVVEDVTKEVKVEELLSMEAEADSLDTELDSTRRNAPQPSTPLGEPEVHEIDLDERSKERSGKAGPAVILVVDDDFASRHLLVKELQPAGYTTRTASGGSEAVRLLKGAPPDAVILDVMLPEIDGFQICRAIKQSQRYRHIPVILMSAVIDSGRVTDRVLRQYGADAYFEKPLNTDRIKARLSELLAEPQSEELPARRDRTFKKALELYRRGDLEGAIGELRAGIREDPLSPKHHFVLANLLQKQELLYEAIDEYESTIDLRPDYFPALTRLAYLYYKKGFSARAIETWRRSLPYCPDPDLRENIELFMRKLIAGMQASQ